MLKITLENGSAYEVLPETACYPSMSTTARSHLENPHVGGRNDTG